jgi:hypothetical protein
MQLIDFKVNIIKILYFNYIPVYIYTHFFSSIGSSFSFQTLIPPEKLNTVLDASAPIAIVTCGDFPLDLWRITGQCVGNNRFLNSDKMVSIY